jgi:MFS family permease
MSQDIVQDTPTQAPAKAAASPAIGQGQWMVLAAAFLGWMFDGLEMGVFPLAARPALQDLLHVTGDKLVGQWMGYITAVFLIGAACGGLIFGWLGDRIGRVRTMIISVLMYSLFTGACYFVTAPWQLGAFRFLAALGMGGEWSLGVALVMECWPEKRRPLLAGLIGAAANFGFGLIGAVAIRYKVTVDSWRWVSRWSWNAGRKSDDRSWPA